MRVLLLNISDIHILSYDKPENEGLVLSKFIVDVEEQVKKFYYDDVFVLISGDLVFAPSDESYGHTRWPITALAGIRPTRG